MAYEVNLLREIEDEPRRSASSIQPAMTGEVVPIKNDKMMTDIIKGYATTISSAINTVPSIMQEQRENFRTMMDVFDMMEQRGMITVNRPQTVEERTEATWKETIIGAAAIIGSAMLLALIL